MKGSFSTISSNNNLNEVTSFLSTIKCNSKNFLQLISISSLLLKLILLIMK